MIMQSTMSQKARTKPEVGSLRARSPARRAGSPARGGAATPSSPLNVEVRSPRQQARGTPQKVGLQEAWQIVLELAYSASTQIMQENAADLVAGVSLEKLLALKEGVLLAGKRLEKEDDMFTGKAVLGEVSNRDLQMLVGNIRESSRRLAVALSGGAGAFRSEAQDDAMILASVAEYLDASISEALNAPELRELLSRFGQQVCSGPASNQLDPAMAGAFTNGGLVVAPGRQLPTVSFQGDFVREDKAASTLRKLMLRAGELLQHCEVLAVDCDKALEDRAAKEVAKEELLQAVRNLVPVLSRHVIRLLSHRGGLEATMLPSLFAFELVEETHRQLEECRDRLQQELARRNVANGRSRVESTKSVDSVANGRDVSPRPERPEDTPRSSVLTAPPMVLAPSPYAAGGAWTMARPQQLMLPAGAVSPQGAARPVAWMNSLPTSGASSPSKPGVLHYADPRFQSVDHMGLPMHVTDGRRHSVDIGAATANIMMPQAWGGRRHTVDIAPMDVQQMQQLFNHQAATPTSNGMTPVSTQPPSKHPSAAQMPRQASSAAASTSSPTPTHPHPPPSSSSPSGAQLFVQRQVSMPAAVQTAALQGAAMLMPQAAAAPLLPPGAVSSLRVRNSSEVLSHRSSLLMTPRGSATGSLVSVQESIRAVPIASQASERSI
eukprot:TRINITY_DN48643_c0_g1_i2.p1 TRINITY_DN48643_c0_g1~~TRINITY_DN48643_c0_g1_i2.p1  ORF type:complete len:665 (+),score=164.11 TRINITY_DN48643_c0_g1_i2:205-2199(+)